ncbi:PKD-like family protein [Mucilaginibacter gossypiicola]|uniref:PKD-like family protein n=1 Tax=Mucilaginibacter gossypiicola TaxID=551995 RepID=A0A1H8TW86_9SPHI|nr:PKD-like family lipoprotein [Mucilaginibacter gossypiicola]SEO95157.1 PKD-like family protein [Mucilaginibacter gossypiicola]
MKLKSIAILVFITVLYTSCKKDPGNYVYSPPSEPVVAGLNNETFPALLGDTLTIQPKITLAGADPLKDLDFEWHITVQEELREAVYKGYPLKMVYNLGPGDRACKLTITDKRNGLFYNFVFKITGTTQFSAGSIVLSNDNGVTKLSFVKPDKTMLGDIYKSLNKDDLPINPVELYYSKPLPYQPNTKEEYWVLSNDPNKSGVVLDASTLLKRTDFAAQFFSPPAVINTGYLEPFLGPVQMGTVPTGVINGKLYVGVSSTAPFADDYGKFANEQGGDYTMSKYFTHGSSFFIGYDVKGKAFITFGSDGTYSGTNYKIDTASTGFDPKNVGYDNLLFMKPTEGGPSYAFFKTATGTITELSFSYPMGDDRTFKGLGKRIFKGSALIDDDTRWVVNSLNVFYFSSKGKIYRYNPINEDIRQLDADFGGKKVSMMKISLDDNTLTVGADGAVYTLDISVSKTGNITKTITGIPGEPIDIVIR